MEKISEHITYEEGRRSFNAQHHGIDNTPTTEQLLNMKALAEHVFEPLREKSGGLPINIEVFHRSGKLQRSALTGKKVSVNGLAGGATKSQHLTEGRDSAIDLDNDKYSNRAANRVLFLTAYNNLDVNYDQLIAENIDDSGHVGWVHASHKRGMKQRRESLVMLFYYKNEDNKKKDIKEKSYQRFTVGKGLLRKNYLLPGWL